MKFHFFSAYKPKQRNRLNNKKWNQNTRTAHKRKYKRIRNLEKRPLGNLAFFLAKESLKPQQRGILAAISKDPLPSIVSLLGSVD